MPLRILVIEDFAPFRRLVCAELQRHAKFQTLEATDGLEGLRKAHEAQPDLILLDINLPKMHGFEVAEQIFGLAPQAKLLFLSQESAPDIVRKALSLGAHGYIQKVSAATDLLPAIDAVLAGRRFVSRSLGFLDPADAPAPHRHEMVFCSDDAAVVDALTRFLAAALRADDAAIALVTESRRTRLLQELRAQGVDVDGAIDRGMYVSFDADVAPERVRFLEAIDGVRAAARVRKAQSRVAFCGERAGRLWAAGKTEEAVQALAQLCAEHTAVSAASPNARRV